MSAIDIKAIEAAFENAFEDTTDYPTVLSIIIHTLEAAPQDMTVAEILEQIK